MAKGVLIHNRGTSYNDVPSERYHFPSQYLKRISQFVNDWIIYYESGKNGGKKSYLAAAKIEKIIPDPEDSKKYYALIEPRSYVDFEVPVPFRKSNGKVANTFLTNTDGSLNNGKIVWAAQPISDLDFIGIINDGIPDKATELPRNDSDDEVYVSEMRQEPFLFDQDRKTVDVLIAKKLRDRSFRSNVINAYDKRCAFTGLRFINGGGRAEVQAAHIKPVSENGPDSIQNGIALSGTVHWMFDRGMLSLAPDFSILVSRHVNNIDELDKIIVPTRKAIIPEKRELRPHASFLEWHTENCFKH